MLTDVCGSASRGLFKILMHEAYLVNMLLRVHIYARACVLINHMQKSKACASPNNYKLFAANNSELAAKAK